MAVITGKDFKGTKIRVPLDANDRYLDLRLQSLTTVDLSAIRDLSRLRKITLIDNLLSKIELEPIKNCKSLELLSLRRNYIEEIDLQPLGACLALEFLDLSINELNEIDLTPLSNCDSLQELRISYNNLTEIDLSPLSSCVNLRLLAIDNNKIRKIDLSPLSSCSKLSELRLFDMKLDEIDLVPIGSCTFLERLYLTENLIKEIDLSPLESCERLTTLAISQNQIEEVDLAPLSKCRLISHLYLSHNRLNNLDLKPLVHNNELTSMFINGNIDLNEVDISYLLSSRNLSLIKADAETKLTSIIRPRFKHKFPYPKGIRKIASRIHPSSSKDWIQQYGWFSYIEALRNLYYKITSDSRFELRFEILRGLELEFLSGFDGNIVEVVSKCNVEDEFDFLFIHHLITNSLIKSIEKRLKKKGSTLYFDVEQMSTTSAAILVPRILERRKQEMTETRVLIKDEMIHLEPIWLTSYGYEILKALAVGLKIPSKRLDWIRKKFRGAGFPFQTTKKESNVQIAVTASEELQKYHFAQIEKGEINEEIFPEETIHKLLTN